MSIDISTISRGKCKMKWIRFSIIFQLCYPSCVEICVHFIKKMYFSFTSKKCIKNVFVYSCCKENSL